MSGRPEILFPLFAGLETLEGVGPKTATNFARMGVERPRDLLFRLPISAVNRQVRASIRGANAADVITVEVRVGQHHPPKSRARPYRVTVEDRETSFDLVFFHAREAYLHGLLPTGQRRVVSGKLEFFDGVGQMVHPDYILPPQEAGDIPAFEPLYPLTEGISQKTMAKAVRGALHRVPRLAEWVDPALKLQENWPDWDAAIAQAHAPEIQADLAPDSPARARLAYDELFAHQLTLALARQRERHGKGRPSVPTGKLQAKALENLGFELTNAQKRAVDEITHDMAAPQRMMRLLQGDVGSGKTLVAFLALLVAVESGGQGVIMAPTEILARQHFQALQPLARTAGVRLDILTGRDKGSARAEKISALATGDIQILIGTHAVFQKDIIYHDLRLAIVDEQHRFGVRQRLELGAKGQAADVLVMTATPIPRSLSLAQYGDMDVSVLDEKPPGRKPIKTVMVSDARMDEVVSHLRKAIARNQQAYWVCPLVDESEVSDLAATQERFKFLRAKLGEGKVGLVHGQLPAAEKDAAMARFAAGDTSVLVATTVIEVGVDVPGATIMVIERAESFGLAQLHQLRGRVGRGTQASTCLMLYKPPLSATGARRLSIMRETDDGFRIAEEDLLIRGAGDLIGTAQSGLPKFLVADLEHQCGLMALAQKDARNLLLQDPGLESARGQAARVLLWLMEQDKAIGLITVG